MDAMIIDHEEEQTPEPDPVPKQLPDVVKKLSKRVKSGLKRLQCWERIEEPFLSMKTSLSLYEEACSSDDSQFQTIIAALKNIAKRKKSFPNENEKRLFEETCKKAFRAVRIYCDAVRGAKCPEIAEIERRLFTVVFTPSTSDYSTQVYPVYDMHDKFLTTKSPYCNFKSSTGSGKTRCAPFFFAIKALEDDLARPFMIMTQPSGSIIRDKVKDFKATLGECVQIVTNYNEVYEMYKSKEMPSKPVVCMLTPYNVAKLLAASKTQHLEVESRTRFVLDEIHERSVETDAMVAMLAKGTRGKTCPLEVLMMSATPDDRVLRTFGDVEMFELEDAQLFPIDDRAIEAPNVNSVTEVAVHELSVVINQMASGEIEPGHVLIFTSGNRRINDIISLLTKKLGNKKVEVLEGMDKKMDNVKGFYRDLKAVLKRKRKNSKKELYVLPIKYAGFVGQEQQEIAKKSTQGQPDLIKVIVATNAIESSITIDGLAVVVDCGIWNEPHFDKQSGLTSLSECPISVQSQTQRRGRVGRTRAGACIQITIKGHPPTKVRAPAIETDDISSNILSLRRIGIELENLENLPNPVPKEEIDDYIKSLTAYGALSNDAHKRLTELGKKLSKFQGLAPYLSSSVVQTAEMYDEDPSALLVGALACYIMTYKDLVGDCTVEPLRRHFCSDSDVITIMTTMADMMTVGGVGPRSDQFAAFGFQQQNCRKVISNINDLGTDLLVMEEEDRIRDIIWEKIQTFCADHDVMEFLNRLLANIGSRKSHWIECRRAKFEAVENVKFNPRLIYMSSSLHESRDETVLVNMRPGSQGLASPGRCLVFQISSVEGGDNYGAIIHKDWSMEETMHPAVIEAGLGLNNDFAVPLIEAYISQLDEKSKGKDGTDDKSKGKDGTDDKSKGKDGKDEKSKDKDEKDDKRKGKDGKERFNRFQEKKDAAKFLGSMCFPTFLADKVLISYIVSDPSDVEAHALMKSAVECVSKIIPYSPRCVLIRHDDIKVIVSITSYGCQLFNTRVIKYQDVMGDNRKLHAYRLDRDSMNFLAENVGKLGNVDENLVIAMTGEEFEFPNEDKHFPLTADFRNNRVFCGKTHLVVVSKDVIPNATELDWFDHNIRATYEEEDAYMHVANTMLRGGVIVRHTRNMLYARKSGGNVSVTKGKLPSLPPDVVDVGDRGGKIHQMLDRYGMFCIDGGKLAREVQLEEFQTGLDTQAIGSALAAVRKVREKKPDIKVDVLRGLATCVSEFGDLCGRRNSLYEEIKKVKERANALSQEYQSREANKRQIKAEQARVKSRKQELFLELEPVKARITALGDQLSQALGIAIPSDEWKAIKMGIANLAAIPLGLLDIKNIQCRPGLLFVPSVPVDECPAVARQLEACGYRVESVAQCDIVIKHFSSNGLSKTEFEKRVKKVCDRFGPVIAHLGRYEDTPGNQIVKGLQHVSILSVDFSIPFAGEMRDQLFHEAARLRIPDDIIPACVVCRNNCQEFVKKWVKKNDLKVKVQGPFLIGSDGDVKESEKKMKEQRDQLIAEMPCQIFSIRGGTDIDRLSNAVRRKNRSLGMEDRWSVVRSERLLVVPSRGIKRDEIEGLVERVLSTAGVEQESEEERILCDIYFCGEDAEKSSHQVVLYEADGSAVCCCFCASCVKDILENATSSFYDKKTGRLNLTAVQPMHPIQIVEGSSEGSEWPSIPLGQLLWCMVRERSIMNLARVWVTGISYQALRSCPIFDVCPNHPDILLPNPGPDKRLACVHRDCDLSRCAYCGKWHKKGPCPEKTQVPRGMRVCPSCKHICLKESGCNHVCCIRCGKHFCYYCQRFCDKDSSPVYAHMKEKHGGYFNNPPDYRKFIKDENVSDAELEDFYTEYPELENLMA